MGHKPLRRAFSGGNRGFWSNLGWEFGGGLDLGPCSFLLLNSLVRSASLLVYVPARAPSRYCSIYIYLEKLGRPMPIFLWTVLSVALSRLGVAGSRLAFAVLFSSL